MNDVNVCPRTEASGESRDAEYAGGGVTFSFPIAVLSSPHCMSSSHFTFNAGSFVAMGALAPRGGGRRVGADDEEAGICSFNSSTLIYFNALN